ncbi:MAG TPA: hypothetical protein DCX95_02745 [Elusimicrobia bacterium]|nr:hypothetical protein [Elusimicrobiota bacterium]
MKKMLMMLFAVAFSTLVFAEEQVTTQSTEGEKVSVEKRVRNKGLEKQLRIMEKTLTKKGVDKEGIEAAKQECKRMCETGLTPEESRSAVAEMTMECHKQGLRGKELASKVRETAQTRTQSRIREKERIRAKDKKCSDPSCDEVKEKIRTGRPEGKGGSGSGSGGDAGGHGRK